MRIDLLYSCEMSHTQHILQHVLRHENRLMHVKVLWALHTTSLSDLQAD